jgi:hypothetical protein
MDGEWTAGTSAQALSPDRTLPERRDIGRSNARQPNMVRWFGIVAALLTLVLGGLYGFNRFREQGIAA